MKGEMIDNEDIMRGQQEQEDQTNTLQTVEKIEEC
jgi:hypothetical protein